MSVLRGAEPFAADGDRTGVLLLHGYTGTPHSMRAWAQAFADAGRSVRLPLLPGHGTRWQDLNATRWPDWYAAAEEAFEELAAGCEQVFVVGLSMGGALALRLAQEHPDRVAGLVLVNPALTNDDPRRLALPLLRHLVPSMPGIASDIARPGVRELAYDRNPLHAAHSLLQLFSTVRADLHKVSAPILLLRSEVDHVVPASSSSLIMAEVSSGEVHEVVLANSYHVATLDHDAQQVIEAGLAFVARMSADVEGAS